MIIDVHGHLSPPESLRRFPMPPSLGDVEGMIERKLDQGIGLTVIGSPVGAGAMAPGLAAENYSQSEDVLAAFHEWIAETVREHPDHLRGYVYANPFGGERHLARAQDTARGDHFVGFVANSSVLGRYTSGPPAEDFWAMAADTGLPVLLHAPALPAAAAGLDEAVVIEQLGRFCDVAIAVAMMLLDGVFDRHPDLRLIVPGTGGLLTLLPERLDMAADPPHWVGPPSRTPPRTTPPSAHLSRLMVDTSTTNRAALALMLEHFGPTRVLVGTDSPPLGEAAIRTPLTLLSELVPDRDELALVHEGNARSLFGERLAQDLVPTRER
ncbi:amidohydrolase family protein [Nocardiopsis alba]|uniref:amidohydrolase family protein n=1 Tax=Nocardiopsis alba TaxID=53437 RepID=UPI00367120E7